MENKSKLKILCITRKYPPQVGGMENFSYFLLNNFDKDRVDTKIVALGKKQYHLIWFFPYSLLYTLLTLKKWDVIYVGDAVLCAIGFFAKLFSPHKITVVNVYGLDITFQNKLYQLYLKLFYNRFDRYICISKETEKEFLNRGGKLSLVITPGVDVHKYSGVKRNRRKFCEKYQVPEDTLVLLTVGRLVKRKGAAWFVEHVMPKLTGKNICYFIIGGGEDRDRIQSLMEKYDLSHKVRLLGRVSEEDLNFLYVNGDVFVMPNIAVKNDMEGFGIVAVEAALAGLIVVASAIEGIKDAVIDGKNGFLMESGNEVAYLEKILDIEKNRENYRKNALDFQQYTKEEYSWEAVCREYVTLFEELAGRGDMF